MTEGDSFIIKEIKEKLETIFNRLESLENLCSRYKETFGDKIDEKTEQPREAVNSQEQMVNIKNFKMLHFENLELFINLKSKTFF